MSCPIFLFLLMLPRQVFLDLSERSLDGSPKLSWGLPDAPASHWATPMAPGHPPFQAFPVRPWSPPPSLPLPGFCD